MPLSAELLDHQSKTQAVCMVSAVYSIHAQCQSKLGSVRFFEHYPNIDLLRICLSPKGNVCSKAVKDQRILAVV